jgi:hypothetical protein
MSLLTVVIRRAGRAPAVVEASPAAEEPPQTARRLRFDSRQLRNEIAGEMSRLGASAWDAWGGERSGGR